jgi:hypothetical protein
LWKEERGDEEDAGDADAEITPAELSEKSADNALFSPLLGMVACAAGESSAEECTGEDEFGGCKSSSCTAANGLKSANEASANESMPSGVLDISMRIFC